MADTSRALMAHCNFLLSLVHGQFMANVPLETRSLDQIYTQAQGEQCDLTVVGGGDSRSSVRCTGLRLTLLIAVEQYAFIVDGFEKRFPKVSLNLIVDLSKYLDSRIDRAFLVSEQTVDVALLQQLNDFTRWKDQTRLIYYKPANFSDIVGGYKDPDGAFLPTFVCK